MKSYKTSNTKSNKKESNNEGFDNVVIKYTLQLLALLILLYFCFEIIKPFINLLIWGSGLLIIPPPDENIKSWPVIGPTLLVSKLSYK